MLQCPGHFNPSDRSPINHCVSSSSLICQTTGPKPLPKRFLHVVRSRARRQTKGDTKTDAGSSVISSDLKHRANDARDGLSSYSNRRDQSGLNGCCAAMWKANGKTTTLSLFLDSLFPKTEAWTKI